MEYEQPAGMAAQTARQRPPPAVAKAYTVRVQPAAPIAAARCVSTVSTGQPLVKIPPTEAALRSQVNVSKEAGVAGGAVKRLNYTNR